MTKVSIFLLGNDMTFELVDDVFVLVPPSLKSMMILKTSYLKI